MGRNLGGLESDSYNRGYGNVAFVRRRIGCSRSFSCLLPFDIHLNRVPVLMGCEWFLLGWLIHVGVDDAVIAQSWKHDEGAILIRFL